MESIKSIFWKPDPAAQLRKCNQLIRRNTRELERAMINLKNLETKAKNSIVQTSKSKSSSTASQTRLLARELVRIRRQSSRLATAKAQLQSVGMQVNEAFSVRKIEGSIRASTSVMKDVNSLVRLPELTGTMRELSMELVRAGIIEEMVDDTLTSQDIDEDEEEAESEVDKVLVEIMGGRLKDSGKVPTVPEQVQIEVEEDPDVVLEDMRERLEALKS
ncbi:Vacuolar protein-sorting-associated protein 24 [Rhizina undulata]